MMNNLFFFFTKFRVKKLFFTIIKYIFVRNLVANDRERE